MTHIVVHNVVSQLHTDKASLKVVRYHVAYRKRLMPSVDAQKVIKRFYSARRRYGGVGDMGRLFADEPTCAELEALGVTEETLTRPQFESTVRQRGVWDGWVRLVNADGSFPTGLLRHVERALTLRLGVDYTISDERVVPARGVPWASLDLYDYQEAAVEAFLGAGRGVVDLPPRSGKTRIAVAVSAALGVPTLYIAPTIGIVNQTAGVFQTLLPHKTTIGVHSGLSSSAKTHRKLVAADVIVATPQTATKLPNLHTRLLLIVDEFHHSAAKTWQAASIACSSAFWRLGLTGTHFRADGKDLEMAGVLGRSIYSRSVGDMVEAGRLVPARIAMLRIRGSLRASGYDIYKKGVVECLLRNQALADAANALVSRGRRVLVLTKEIDHAQRLSMMIRDSVAVDGRDNDRVDEMLKKLGRGEVSAVVGTSVIGEGRDVPAADALVYGSGGQSKVKVVQDYFRALTASEGKTTAIVVDAADTHHETLLDHSARRLQHYRGEKAFLAEVVEPEDFEKWLDDNDVSVKRHIE